MSIVRAAVLMIRWRYMTRCSLSIQMFAHIVLVMPPAVATDRGVPTQSVWNIGWNYKGLTSAVRLLKRIKHRGPDDEGVHLKYPDKEMHELIPWTEIRSVGTSRLLMCFYVKFESLK